MNPCKGYSFNEDINNGQGDCNLQVEQTAVLSYEDGAEYFTVP